MKTKKRFAVLAALLACSALGLSGCTEDNYKITFGNYWNQNAESGVVKQINETCEYTVTFDDYDSSFVNYDLNYAGTYKTSLVSSQEGNYGFIYTFFTELKLKTTFTVDGESETFDDYMTSSVKFYAAGGTDNLRPISSTKEIYSHSPIANESADAPDECYSLYHYRFTNDYTDGGKCKKERIFSGVNEETGEITESIASEDLTFSASSSKHNVLDNEQFPAVFRAMPSGTDSTVRIFNPYIEGTQDYAVSLSDDTDEYGFSFDFNGEELTNKTLEYYTATIGIDANASGQPQTAWIASADSFRRVMLYYRAPVANNIGALEYTLKSVRYL